jgi:hypothetical protein
VVEDGGGVAEDEVDAAFDVGVDVVLAAVVGEEGVLMAEEAAVFEDGAVAAVGYGYGLAGVAGGVLEGDVVGLEAGAVDLDGLGEEGAAGGFGVEGVGDDDVGGGFAHADESDVVVVLGDDDALVIGARGDLDEDAAGCAVGVGCGKGVVIECVDDGGEGGEVLIAGVGVRRGGVDADVDVGCVGGEWGGDEERDEEFFHGENEYAGLDGPLARGLDFADRASGGYRIFCNVAFRVEFTTYCRDCSCDIGSQAVAAI